MKKTLLLLFLILSMQCSGMASGVLSGNVIDTTMYKIYPQDGVFGVKNSNGDVIVEPKYKKIIRVGKSSFIIQEKNKFGLMDANGNVILQPKYSHAERMAGRFAKIGNDGKMALYDEFGSQILPHEYRSIDIMYGQMFLTNKKYRYGLISYSGRVILENKFEDMYMPQPNILRIQYKGSWYEIEQVDADTLTLPEEIETVMTDDRFRVSQIVRNPMASTGYSVVTLSDYILRIISTISPAYEATIDTLMLSQGADIVSIYMKLGWIPKFPITYAKKYYEIYREPNRGPLSEIKQNLKKHVNEE